MREQVSGDLGNHQEEEVDPEITMKAGGGEVDAVIADVGGEPEHAHDDQPQLESHRPGLGVRKTLGDRQRI